MPSFDCILLKINLITKHFRCISQSAHSSFFFVEHLERQFDNMFCCLSQTYMYLVDSARLQSVQITMCCNQRILIYCKPKPITLVYITFVLCAHNAHYCLLLRYHIRTVSNIFLLFFFLCVREDFILSIQFDKRCTLDEHFTFRCHIKCRSQ